MNRRKLLRSIGSGAVAVPLAGCSSGSGVGTSEGSGSGGPATTDEPDEDTPSATATAEPQPATIFQNVTLQNEQFVIEINPEADVERVNLLNEDGQAKGGKPLAEGASEVRVRSFETIDQNVTFIAVNNEEEVARVTKEYGPDLSFGDLRQPALDDESSGIPGEQDRDGGENPYTTLVVDITNNGNVPFTATGISVVSGVPQPGDASQTGTEFTIKPGQTKTVQADDASNSVVAAWGGSWGAEGAPDGSCQGESEDAKLLVVSDNGRKITKTFKLVYRGGLYTMHEVQNFETCGRIHSVGYRPARPDLNRETTAE